MLRRPSSAAFGGVGESLSDSDVDVFGKDGLPGQVRQCRTGRERRGRRDHNARNDGAGLGTGIPNAPTQVVFARPVE